ncbi:MAG: hypothetical protein QOE07_42 [Acidimicrobiaceae bacterium]|jgi:uncharacterized protein (DUF433 family)|nr:hypothetical protein [Acidimicrobiaceae bacterium]MDQ1411454.1 hypothetical protein [Acidimicrobiaceae bacterium]MDQ1416189.1 hypothetical protein [Acidimicrobiaceae bacterium]
MDVLDREMYAEAEAARLLKLPQGTLHYWLEGGQRATRTYLPVIRVEPTGSRVVTWGEFVEAALLRQYRRKHKVPMAELRAVIERLRERLGVPYPLAHSKPFVGPGRRLLLAEQEAAHLPGDFWLVAIADGQPTLTAPSETFFERVEWDQDLALGWRPAADNDSPVRMRPDVRFGLPAVSGIRTEVIWEHLEAGEAFEDVAGEFGLSLNDVRWAHAFETSLPRVA